MKNDNIEDIYKYNPELKKYIEEYLYTEYNTSKNTRDSYAYDLINFAKSFENKNIAYLKKEDIQEYILKEKDKSSKTKAHYLTVLNNFYVYLYNNNYINSNPCESIKMPKIEKKSN